MAKKIVYNIEISSEDAQGSIKRIEERLLELNQTADTSQREINSLTQELKELGQTRTDQTENINSVQSLRRAYRELIEELQLTEEGTERFNELAQAAGEVKDKIDAAQDSVNNFNKSPFENLKANFAQLTSRIRDLDLGGFQQSFRDLTVNFRNLGSSLLGLDKGLTLAQIGFRGLGLAIAATGIGAVIGLISVLIRNFDLLKSSGGLLGKVFSNIGGLVNSFTTSILKLSDALGLTENALENFRKKANEGVQANVKTEAQAAKEISDLRKELYNRGLDDLGKALAAERDLRQKEFAVFISDLKDDIQTRKITEEDAFAKNQEFIKESERRLENIRKAFAIERGKEEKKTAEERFKNLISEIDKEKELKDRQFKINVLDFNEKVFQEEKKLSKRLSDAREAGYDIRATLSGILDDEFIIRQSNVNKLYQIEYAYYDQLYEIREQLIEQSKKAKNLDEQLFFAERIADITKEISEASEASTERFIELYSNRFEELSNILTNEPQLWDNVFEGFDDETEARFQAVEQIALDYRNRITEIIAGGAKRGLFTELIPTSAANRQRAAGELAKVEQVLDDIAKRRLNRAQEEIVVLDKLTNQQLQLTDSERVKLEITLQAANQRVDLLKKYKLTETDIYQEAEFQQKVAERNLTKFIQSEYNKRKDDAKKYYDEVDELNKMTNQSIAQTTFSATSQIERILNQRYNYELQLAGDNQDRINEIQKEQFETNKAFGIVNTIINTAQGIMNVWANTPNPVAAGILSGVVAAIGAAEVALIASQEFQPNQSANSSFTPNAQGSQSLGAISGYSPNIQFAQAGSGANIQTQGGGSPQSVQFTGSISVSEINNTQQLVNVYETGSLLGGG